MKKVIALMLGLVATTASFAQTTVAQMATTPFTQVSVTAAHKLKLLVTPSTAVATVTLQDADGHQLYSEQVDLQAGLYKQFDMADLAGGTYQLTVTIGSETINRLVVIAEKPAQKEIILQRA